MGTDEEKAQEVVEWLEIRLGPLPQLIKTFIAASDISYIRGDEEEQGMLLKRVRELLAVYENRPAPSGTALTGRTDRAGLSEIEVLQSAYTVRRGEVFAEVTAALAGQRRDVRAFRGRLPNYPISEDQAEAYLEKHGGQRDRLDRIARTLSRFYGWRIHAAVHFVLTGEKPHYQPTRTTYAFAESSQQAPNTARVIIEADVWVDATEVGNAFRTAQRQIKDGDNRRVSERTLTLAAFVSQRLRGRGAGSRREWWRECWREWNKKHPSWRYSEQHGFKQAFDRFIHPKYRRPRFKKRDSS